MKTFQKLTVLLSMLCLLSAIPAMAQVDNRLTFQAPFAFYAGNAKLPAGSYTVTQQDDNTGPSKDRECGWFALGLC